MFNHLVVEADGALLSINRHQVCGLTLVSVDIQLIVEFYAGMSARGFCARKGLWQMAEVLLEANASVDANTVVNARLNCSRSYICEMYVDVNYMRMYTH